MIGFLVKFTWENLSGEDFKWKIEDLNVIRCNCGVSLIVSLFI